MKVARLAGLAVLSIAPSALAQWSDGFEAYAVGTLPPQGGWTDFGGTQPIAVSTTQAHTGTKSMRLREGTAANTGYGSDIFINPPGTILSTGEWTLSWWHYSTGDCDDFMFVSTGAMPGTFNEGLFIYYDVANRFIANTPPVLMAVQGANIIGTGTLVQNVWAEHRIEINLYDNKMDYFFNGAQIVNDAAWDATLGPGPGATLGGFNFWKQFQPAAGANATQDFTFYDDFNLALVPAPGSAALLGLGGLLMARRRRA